MLYVCDSSNRCWPSVSGSTADNLLPGCGIVCRHTLNVMSVGSSHTSPVSSPRYTSRLTRGALQAEVSTERCTIKARQTGLFTVGVGRCALAQVREQLHMQKRTAGNRWVRDTVTQRHVRQDVPWGLQDGSAVLPVIDAARAAHLALPLVGAVPCSPWQAAHHPTTNSVLKLLRLGMTVLRPAGSSLMEAMELKVHTWHQRRCRRCWRCSPSLPMLRCSGELLGSRPGTRPHGHRPVCGRPHAGRQRHGAQPGSRHAPHLHRRAVKSPQLVRWAAS